MSSSLLKCEEFEPVSIRRIPERSAAWKYLDFRGVDGPDRLIVAVRGYVGLLPLDKDQALLVRPKTELPDWLGFMLYAEKPYSPLEGRGKLPFDRGPTSSHNLLALVALQFLSEIDEVVRRGIRKEYLPRDYNEPYLRGKVDLPRHIRENFLRGRLERIAFRGVDLTSDTLANQTLRAALTVLLRLERRQILRPSLSRDLSLALACFERVSDALIDIRQIELLLAKLPPSSAYYRPALVLARAILQANVPVLEGRPELVLPGFLFNMNEAFERFVRNSVRHAVIGHADIAVENGNLAPRELFQTESEWKIKPDVLLTRSGHVRLLVDAKYKLAVKEQDLYQVITYMAATGSKEAILVYPLTTPGQVDRRYQLGEQSILVHFANLADWRSASLDLQRVCAGVLGFDRVD